jgi:iron-sulfur cluster assembly accessory protein
MIQIRSRKSANDSAPAREPGELSISLTDNAKAQLQRMGASKDRFLRIRAVPGGCSGTTYHAALDSEIGGDDRVVYSDGDLRVVCDRQSSYFIDGLGIDYSSDLIKSGFRLTNPNANRACGCGSSFAA